MVWLHKLRSCCRGEGRLRRTSRLSAINAKSSTLHNNLGMSLYFSGDYRKAGEELVEALKLDPENPKIYNNLGLVFFKLKRYDDALEALKKGADDATVYNNLGYLFMADGNNAKAIEMLSQALEKKSAYYAKAQQNLDQAQAGLEPEPAR